jgi:hypothetical protein
MASVIALDASPLNMLRAMRGSIIAARLAYPEVLHVEIRDPSGGIWRLATQDAEFSPRDPNELLSRSIEEAELDGITGELRVQLSDGTTLAVIPAPRESSDDPPNWELITPDGLALEFGPGMRWQISSSDVRTSARG